MKNIFLLIIILLSLFSCEEKEFDLFDGENQIYFAKFFVDELHPGKAEADSTACSFFFYPETTNTISVNLEILLSGKLLEKDTDFKLKVIEDETTAKADEYTIADSYTFHCNTVTDTSTYIRDFIEIKLNKTERLKTLEEGTRLVVELVPNENLALGQFERRRAVIHFTTQASRPEWWDSEVVSKLLGTYSTKKYKLFLMHADPDATLNKEMIETNPSQAIKLTMKFKEWLIANPQIDENGEPMVVKV